MSRLLLRQSKIFLVKPLNYPVESDQSSQRNVVVDAQGIRGKWPAPVFGPVDLIEKRSQVTSPGYRTWAKRPRYWETRRMLAADAGGPVYEDSRGA